VPTLSVSWGATGIIAKEVYEGFKVEMLERIIRAGRLDGVLLALHGAMSSESAPDGEGSLLKAIREIVGEEIPIVAVLDKAG